MSILAGPVFAIAAVMGVAGVLKLARPELATQALRATGLPDSVVVVRALALTEIVVGALAIGFGTSLTAAAVCAYYAGFAVFAFVLVRRADDAPSCGCFGETTAESPTTGVHVVMNVVAALLAGAAIIWPTGGLLEVMADQPLAGIPFVVLTGLLAWAWYLTITVLPAVLTAMSPDDRSPGVTATRPAVRR